jgi:hypothetical protein
MPAYAHPIDYRRRSAIPTAPQASTSSAAPTSIDVHGHADGHAPSPVAHISSHLRCSLVSHARDSQDTTFQDADADAGPQVGLPSDSLTGRPRHSQFAVPGLLPPGGPLPVHCLLTARPSARSRRGYRSPRGPLDKQMSCPAHIAGPGQRGEWAKAAGLTSFGSVLHLLSRMTRQLDSIPLSTAPGKQGRGCTAQYLSTPLRHQRTSGGAERPVKMAERYRCRRMPLPSSLPRGLLWFGASRS